MSDKHLLRKTRDKTIINSVSKKQEKEIITAINNVKEKILKTHHVKLIHKHKMNLKDIVNVLQKAFPDVDFHYYFDSSNIRPDGGILFIEDTNRRLYPILIAEVKNQGTNDLRIKEGKTKQAKGNAIERLGKNVIGLRAALLTESIFPFVCFGYGCDFELDSSILDRVVTIAMFGELNKTYLHNIGHNGLFNRGSFYFRCDKWNVNEMSDIMYDIANRSILYYYSVYREESFMSKVN